MARICGAHLIGSTATLRGWRVDVNSGAKSWIKCLLGIGLQYLSRRAHSPFCSMSGADDSIIDRKI